MLQRCSGKSSSAGETALYDVLKCLLQGNGKAEETIQCKKIYVEKWIEHHSIWMEANGNVAFDCTERAASVLLTSLGVRSSLRSPSTWEICEKLNTGSQHQTTLTADPMTENLWLSIFSYLNCWCKRVSWVATSSAKHYYCAVDNISKSNTGKRLKCLNNIKIVISHTNHTKNSSNSTRK